MSNPDHESEHEMLSRVSAMSCDRSGKWDLSANDQRALKHVMALVDWAVDCRWGVFVTTSKSARPLATFAYADWAHDWAQANYPHRSEVRRVTP